MLSEGWEKLTPGTRYLVRNSEATKLFAFRAYLFDHERRCAAAIPVATQLISCCSMEPTDSP
jgi:hypothetical protein